MSTLDVRSAAVGFVGLGMLGAPVARCLVDAGHDVTVFDVRRERMESVEGARPATDLADAARASEVLFCCVDGPKTANAVALGDDGAVGAMAVPSTYVELSTMSLDAVRAEAHACEIRGIDFVECPVSGRPPQLTALLGGDARAVDGVRGVVAAFTDHQIHLGPVGSGTVAKLVNQYLTYANFMVAAQGLAMARQHGVAPIELARALDTCAASSRSLTLLASVLECGSADYGSVASILCDLELVRELERDAAMELAAFDELHALFSDAAAARPDRPFPSAVARYGFEALR